MRILREIYDSDLSEFMQREIEMNLYSETQNGDFDGYELEWICRDVKMGLRGIFKENRKTCNREKYNG